MTDWKPLTDTSVAMRRAAMLERAKRRIDDAEMTALLADLHRTNAKKK